MNNTSSDFSSVFLEISLPSSIVKDLDFLSLNLKKMFAGQSADINGFTAGLMRIMEWSKVRTPAENNSASVAWTARYVGLPEVGGTLICQNTEQELMLSLDSKNVVYMGSWRSLQPDQEEHGGIFSIEDFLPGGCWCWIQALPNSNFIYQIQKAWPGAASPVFSSVYRLRSPPRLKVQKVNHLHPRR